MKCLILCLVTLLSFSAMAADLNLRCKGYSLLEEGQFAYSEDKRMLEADFTIGASKIVYVIFHNNSMKLIDNLASATNMKGASVLYLTQASEADDSLLDGVNIFNTTLNSNAPDQYESFVVKSATTHFGNSFSVMDMEKKFGLSCIRM